MYIKIEVYIPDEYAIPLANALNEHDVLREGHYDYAFSTTQVTGYWRPLEGANPFDGTIGEVSREPETKLEFRIQEEHLKDVHRIIREIHPYESPMVNYIPVLSPEEE